MSSFRFTQTKIPGVMKITPLVFGDERGFFMETWNAADFAGEGIDATFVQENHSRSVQGTLRGLHYQTQCAQGKLVRVVEGEIFDVVVDLRRWSPTFGQWGDTTLSAENCTMLWIPPGFAHGFYVLSKSAEFVYKCTDRYAPEFETTLCWDSPRLGIKWPIPAGSEPLLSQKDRAGLNFEDAPVYETPVP